MYPDSTTKRCTKCGEEKPLEQFPPAAGKRDGLSSWCRQCTNDQRRQRYQSDSTYKEQVKNRSREIYHADEQYRERVKARSRGKRVEPISVARVIPIQDDPDAMRRYRERQSTRDRNRRAWYRQNKKRRRADPQKLERIRLIGRLARQRQRARERNAPSTLTPAQWRDILRQQGYKCLGCGRKFGPRLKPEMDHVVSLNDGAPLSYENCQALCRTCNASKGTKHIDYRPGLQQRMELD